MKYTYNQNGIEAINEFINRSKPSKIIVITDDNTRKYCLPVFKNLFSFEFTNVNVKNGDENKNIHTLTGIWDKLLQIDADRKSLIINLGGGMVTDIGGFAAVTFKRGIDFIHVPTSLLGMVDAAIGGKNGINFKQAKNQIGTIVPPQFVWINTGFLASLSGEEIDSGFAEMLKHGLIADKTYWNDLVTHHSVFRSNNDKEKILTLIKTSVDIKDRVITSDPKEQGLRKILNFGHTLGHAIESHLNYHKNMPVSHGKAVAVGMILAAYLSFKLLNFSIAQRDEIKKSILSIYAMIDFSKSDIENIIKLLAYDKKNENGIINFVLLSEIGAPVLDQQVPDNTIREAFDYYKA